MLPAEGRDTGMWTGPGPNSGAHATPGGGNIVKMSGPHLTNPFEALQRSNPGEGGKKNRSLGPFHLALSACNWNVVCARWVHCHLQRRRGGDSLSLVEKGRRRVQLISQTNN